MRTFGVRVTALAALALAFTAPARAEDERGRWSFAFGLGVHSTFDDIRNNGARVISKESQEGAPQDFDLSNDQILVFDTRQDDLLARSTKVEEKQRFDFSAAYGLTSWLSLQVDTGYYQGSVAPLDTLDTRRRWVELDDVSPLQYPTADPPLNGPISNPMTVGQLTQIPLSINAVVRFRKDSPFNPFMGVGVGYLFNKLDLSPGFDELNNQILRGFSRVIDEPSSAGASDVNNLQQIYAGFVYPENQSSEVHGTLVYDVDCTNTSEQPTLATACYPTDPKGFAALPTQPFVQAEVTDGFMYQFSVGADYHFNERWSAFVAARYLVTEAAVSVKIRGTDPVRGSFELDEATFRMIAEGNTVPLDQSDGRFLRTVPPSGTEGCGTATATCRARTLYDAIQVQGGEIGLSAFTVGAGIRFTF